MTYPNNHKCKICRKKTERNKRIYDMCRKCFDVERNKTPESKAYRRAYYKQYFAKKENKIKHARSLIKFWTKKLKEYEKNS